MPAPTDDLPLARDFPAATQDDWRKLVDGVLKGAPFERLVSHSYDGLRIEPVYTRSNAAAVVPGRAAATPWRITQRIDHPDAALANEQAVEDLENGATGLALVFAGAPGAYGFGIEPSDGALARVLEGIHLDAGIDIEISAGPGMPDLPARMARLLAGRAIDPQSANLRFAIDPIGAAAVRGGSDVPYAEFARSTGVAAAAFVKLGFTGPFAVADGRLIHDAGGSEAQELAWVLAIAVAYLRAFEAAGLDLETGRRLVFARLSADADQFMTLAKFRALRLLWSQVERSCGLAPRPLFIAADTAWRMQTARDPYVNLLRATVATFAAGLGGANSITVLPHSLARGLPDALARRLARNTQLVLLEESNLDKVTDPAAGSGGIESLTADLGRAAWSQFQNIEAAGGAFAALERNLLQGQVGAVRAARAKNIARRKDVLTGVSEFPNLHEVPVAVLEAARAADPAAGNAAIGFDALPPIRLATPFEQLRDRSDAMLATRGARPKVFLANIGTHADFTGRATFAKSLFEAGGIEALDGDGGTDPAAIAAAFKASGAPIACLCSSDKVYATLAAQAAQALHAAGARHIYLAGRPGEQEAGMRGAGVNGFVFAGGDALATLTAAYDNL
jgi:methylmalonyl-CoA mutase